MQQLNLPTYPVKTRQTGEKTEIFDPIRRRYIVLTPEEWVRQQFIRYLISEKKYPETLISIEKGIKVNQMYKRFDAVISDQTGKPVVLIEFKSPNVRITQKTFEQVAAYNIRLQVQYLIVSNGLKHYCCSVDHEKKTFSFLDDIPDFSVLTTKDEHTNPHP
ncbi:MAG: hypothetical protein DRI88_00975 [Bacteroidetes bacterium]|nr:MAG: hypothetical protein DRI88_00975 [Bacteroidota bacterium]RLD73088.1 MAG: hypothetical protein DRI87_04910 [Bacteroidota bacterium]RLD89547.1 MAG: hypothetical protein DRJ02_01100 [Bacteroidota bacterium]